MVDGGVKSMDEEENLSSSQEPAEDQKQYKNYMNDLSTANKSG